MSLSAEAPQKFILFQCSCGGLQSSHESNQSRHPSQGTSKVHGDEDKALAPIGLCSGPEIQFKAILLYELGTHSDIFKSAEYYVKGVPLNEGQSSARGGMEKKMSFNFRSFTLAFAHPFLQHQQPLIIQTLGRTIEIDFGQYWTFPTYLWQKESRSPQGSDSERKFWFDRSSKWVFRTSCCM